MLMATAMPKSAVVSKEGAGEEERDGCSPRSIPLQHPASPAFPSQLGLAVPMCWIRGQAPHRSAPAGWTDHSLGPGRLQALQGLKGSIVCPGL